MSGRGRLAGIDVTDDCMRSDRETKFNISKIDGEDIPTTLTWVFSFPIFDVDLQYRRQHSSMVADSSTSLTGDLRPGR